MYMTGPILAGLRGTKITGSINYTLVTYTCDRCRLARITFLVHGSVTHMYTSIYIISCTFLHNI
jgi:hypothetical protein